MYLVRGVDELLFPRCQVREEKHVPEPGGAPNLGAHAHGDAMLLVKQEGRTLPRTPVQSPVSLAHLEHSQVSLGIYRLSLRNPLCTANPWLKF